MAGGGVVTTLSGGLLTEVRFTVPGEPVSKARARFTGYGSKVRTYTPAKTKVAEERVAWAFRSAGGRFEPDPEATFSVTVTFHNGTRQRRDVDNMLKLVLDGLNGVAWVDDTQVMEIAGRKRFGPKAEARTEVIVTRIGVMDRITKPCEHCGEPFITYDSLKERQRFCSQACGKQSRIAGRQRTCEHCRVEFLAHGPARETRFCSRECQSASGRVTIPCAICQTKFEQFKSWAKQRPYCSPECSYEGAARKRRARRSQTFPGTCLICGAGTTRKEYKRCNPCKLAGRAVPE